MFNVNMYTYPMMFSASEYRGTIRMIINQNFDDGTVIKAIYREISMNIPGTVFQDRGRQLYDRLDLELLAHREFSFEEDERKSHYNRTVRQ